MRAIRLNDTGRDWDQAQEYFDAADAWAREHCASYGSFDVTDVSDISLTNDLLAIYLFQDERDAMVFKLKWQS